MLEIILLAFVAIVSYNIGVSVTAWRLRDLVYKEAKARGLISGDEYSDEVNTDPVVSKLWVEKSQDILYLYDYDKNSFVCQAKTLDELAKLALEYKNIKYAAVIMDEKPYMFVDGTVKTKS